MWRRPLLALVAALAALAAAGCGGGGGEGPKGLPPPPSSGLFVGSGADGMGATVDFGGFDATSRAVAAALASRAGAAGRWQVGVASIVNSTGTPRALPTFAAVLEDGRSVPLPAAGRVLAATAGPAAARARGLLPPAGPVPARGAATAYLVLPGVPSGDVVTVRMLVGARQAVDLRPEAR